VHRDPKKYEPMLTFLALPLSFVGIPIYLNIADFYAQKFGLSLVLIGAILAFIRIFDAASDLAIGYYSDFLSSRKISRKKIIIFFGSLLCVGFFFTFNPPLAISQNMAVVWFFITLTLTYSCFNFVIINFEALIALLAKDDKERISLNSKKEFLGLVGMIFAFIIPGIFLQIMHLDGQQSYFYLSLVFIALMVLAMLSLRKNSLVNNVAQTPAKLNFSAIFGDKKFLSFLLIFLLNSIAVSLPAANMNFYVRDVLMSPQNIPWFLTTYFVSAGIFIPMWRYFFNNFGIIKSWIFSISGAILTFASAYFLDASHANYFYAICLFSGIFLGADLIAVPAILAKITQEKSEMVSSYFSLWNFCGKMGLMIAASGSLIVLGFYGYQPGNLTVNLEAQNLNLIAFFYAALPCFIKIAVIILLLKFRKYEN